MKLNDDDENNLENEVEQVVRLGPYMTGKNGPMKITLKAQKDMQTFQLKEIDGCTGIWIRKIYIEE